ncbi:DUF1287 domain-containing protein [soil metagenome]
MTNKVFVLKKFGVFFLIFFISLTFACRNDSGNSHSTFATADEQPKLEQIQSDEIRKLLESANEQLNLTNSYDPNYAVIPYPNGDVPIETGVCTDVVIRAFRNANIDLQKEVHEDIAANFSAYPNKWNLKSPDKNIDHRRVPNLQTFFTRRGKSLPIKQKGEDYKPGDVVSWDLDGKGMTHIGLVSNIYNENTKRYSIIHNIGGGAALEDRIFDWKINGHYRYF